MIYKNDDSVKNTSYINKDFQALWQEMLELIPKYTNKWNPSQANESDPLAVLVKLLAIFSDKLNYNIDKNILEAYPQSLTQEKAAYNVYDILGYNPPWYQSATTDILLNFHTAIPATTLIGEGADNSSSYKLILPKFTQITDEDSNLVYTLLEDFDIISNTPTVKQIKAIQGTINDYIINGIDKITVDNLDSDNRLYFIEPNIAENGIFISNNNFESDFTDGKAAWSRIQNIYQAKATDKVFEFGIDPVSGACYIQFSDSISNLIGEGLSIKYILSDGSAGNTKSYTLNKFLSDTNAIVEGAGDVTSFKINDFINIVNRTEITSGKSPATLDEMYKNYKRIQNTFNTLVTLLDYENYLYQYGDSSSHIVSNILASDRTNDLYESYDVWTIKDNVNALVHKIKQTDEVDNMSKYAIRLYPLAYERDVTTKDSYDRTFEQINYPGLDDFEQSKPFGEALSEVKTINHDFIDFGKPIIINYNLDGQIYLTDKVSRAVADQIELNIQSAIYQHFNARNISFGDPISYKEVLEVIEKSDSRIDYVALEPINYNAYDIDLSKSNITNASGLTPDSTLSKSILAGKTPWSNFITDYSYNAGQANGQLISVATVAEVNKNLGTTESATAQITGLTNPQFSTRVVLGETTKGGTSTNIGETTYDAFRVETNEDLVLYSPNYKEDKTYSNFLYYYAKLNTTVIKDKPYKLSDDSGEPEYIFFYETKDAFYEDCDEAGVPQGIKNVIGILNSGDIIKPNFDLTSNTKANGKMQALSLNNGKTIIELSLNSGSIYIPEVDVKKEGIIAFTNAINLINAFKQPKGSYTLLTGEYFLFKYKNDNSLTILGEGTTLENTSNDPIILTLSPDTIDFNLVVDGNANEVNELSRYEAVLSPEQAEAIKYIVNQILTFGAGYCFFFGKKAGINSTIYPYTFEEIIEANAAYSLASYVSDSEKYKPNFGLNTFSIPSSIDTNNDGIADYQLYYTTDITSADSWAMLPQQLDDINWKGFLRVFADINNTDSLVLINSSIADIPYISNSNIIQLKKTGEYQFVPHQQQICILQTIQANNASYNNAINIKARPLLGTNGTADSTPNYRYPVSVQSSNLISTPGGVVSDISDDQTFYLYNKQSGIAQTGIFNTIEFNSALPVEGYEHTWTVPGIVTSTDKYYKDFNKDSVDYFAIFPIIYPADSDTAPAFKLGYDIKFKSDAGDDIATVTTINIPANNYNYIELEPNKLYYMIAPCGSILFEQGKAGGNPVDLHTVMVGPINVISNTELFNIDFTLAKFNYSYNADNTIKQLVNTLQTASNQVEKYQIQNGWDDRNPTVYIGILGKDSTGINSMQNVFIDPAFNITYQVKESDLVENPLIGSSYLNKNHIYNRYAIPKLNNFNIKISGLSIL